MQEEQVGLSSVHSPKSFSGDLRHSCAPQLYWRFLLPEQDQQRKRSVCTLTAAPHSLPSPAAEAEAHGPFWFYCSGKIASVKAEGTAQKQKRKPNPRLWDFQRWCQNTWRSGRSCTRAWCLQTVLLQARGEVPQHRHNEMQNFTSLHYVQLTKATVFSKVTGNSLKTANVALGLLKIRSQDLPSTTPVLLKACHQKTAATWKYLPWNTEIGKTARKEKIELKDPSTSKARIKSREAERANRSIHPNYLQNPGQTLHSCPVPPPVTACVLLLQHHCLTPTNSIAAACWAGNLIHCKGCWQPEAAPLSIKYPVINYIADWGKGFGRVRIKTQPYES